MPLRDLVLYLGSRQLSGLLQCEDGEDRKTIAIASGVAIMASSTHRHERFSYMLVEKGYISQDKLDLALAQAPGRALGKTLVTQRQLAETTVRETLENKISNTLTALMEWSSGTFSFTEAEATEAMEGLDVSVDMLTHWKAHGADLTGDLVGSQWHGDAEEGDGADTQVTRPTAKADADFAATFRREVKSRLAARGRGKRFPKDLQARAVGHYWRRVRQGSFLSEVARELGLPPPTLRRWVLDAPALAPGEASPDQWASARIEGGRVGGAPVLVGPNGMRVEGLDVETLASLLRRLDTP